MIATLEYSRSRIIPPRRTCNVSPNNVTAHAWYSSLVDSLGCSDEAIAEGKRAQELDPVSPMVTTVVGAALIRARRYDEAIQQLKNALALEPDFVPAHVQLARAYHLRGLHDLSMAESQRLVELGSPHADALMAQSYAASGRTAEALEVLNKLIPRSDRSHSGAFLIADVYALLGDSDQTLVCLEEAYKQHDAMLVFLNVWPGFETLRGDARFQELVRRVGIPSP
jgi:predicted Zn-dependent protease